MAYYSVHLAVRAIGRWKVLWSTRSISCLYCLCERSLWRWTYLNYQWQLHVQATSPISHQAPWTRPLGPSSCSWQCPSSCTYWPGQSFGISRIAMSHDISRLSLPPFQSALIPMMSPWLSKLSFKLTFLLSLLNSWRRLSSSGPHSATTKTSRTFFSWQVVLIKAKLLDISISFKTTKLLTLPKSLLSVVSMKKLWPPQEIRPTCARYQRSCWAHSSCLYRSWTGICYETQWICSLWQTC